MAHGLVGRNRLVEDDPLGRVGDRLGQRAVGRADGLGRQGDGDVVLHALPQAGLVARRPDRDDGRVVEDEAGQLAGGVERGHDLAARCLEQVRAHALLAARHHDGPVRRVPVDHGRLLAAEDPLRPLAAGPGPHGPQRLAVPLLAERHRAAPGTGGQVVQELVRAEGAGGQRGRDGGREEGAGQGDAAHLLHHDARLEQAGAGSAVLLGHQEAGPSQVDQGRPQRGRDAGRVLGQLAQQVGPALTLERAARHLLQCELLVVVREVHGLP